jgi:hypothetical protein
MRQGDKRVIFKNSIMDNGQQRIIIQIDHTLIGDAYFIPPQNSILAYNAITDITPCATTAADRSL